MPVVYPEPEEPIEIARRITGELRGAQGLLPSWDVPELQEIGDLIEADLRAAIASVDSLPSPPPSQDAPDSGEELDEALRRLKEGMEAAAAEAEREEAAVVGLASGARVSQMRPMADGLEIAMATETGFRFTVDRSGDGLVVRAEGAASAADLLAVAHELLVTFRRDSAGRERERAAEMCRAFYASAAGDVPHARSANDATEAQIAGAGAAALREAGRA